MTVAIPIMNQMNDTHPALGLFKYNTSDETEFMFIANGSTEPVHEFISDHLQPDRINYIRNEENLGMVKTLQQAYENCETEILVITHNDVYIYEKDWDQRVLNYFKNMPDLGGVGLFGVQGCGPIGERIQDAPPNTAAGLSNMLEANIHGRKMEHDYMPAANNVYKI